MESTADVGMSDDDPILLNGLETPLLAEFPLGERPTIGPEAPVNPFHEPDGGWKTNNEWNYFQMMKSILLIPLLLVRLVSMITIVAFGYVWIRICLIGVTDPLFKPFNPCRRFMLWGIRLVARAVMFTMGYYYIPIKGKPAHRSEAPIIVSNHIGFLDPIFVFYRHLPVIVSAKENVEMPIIGLFLQALQVEYLPVMKPTVREMKYPHEFASRVRSEMAKALGIVCTEHSFLDIKLALAAEKLKQPSGRSLVEFARMEKLFRLDFPTAKEYLEKFSAMDRTHSGFVTFEELCTALDLPRSPITKQVFNLFDKDGHGSINFREFLAGLAFVSSHTSFSSTMEAAFKACDVNGDGTLSRDEVERSLLDIFPELPPITVFKLFDTLDINHDEKISWEEFSSFLQRNPEYLAIIIYAHPTLLKPPTSTS
uniref:EF-hand domain-containing protein n=1 Tax=Physcomitrium patens TaxID=3218 RepID=A0A7I4FPL7_PHYPA